MGEESKWLLRRKVGLFSSVWLKAYPSHVMNVNTTLPTMGVMEPF